eukprot:NODE_722_length_4463_cov_0.626489.p3 type:complete len:249 gc:universal NODE_722_length_4463_cov_0.626489:1346-2092(+)
MNFDYENFLLTNADRIHGIENALTAVSYLLPGRFKDADIASELLYMILRFVTLYHDKIIGKIAHKFKSKSTHAKYIEHVSQNKSYNLLSHLLTGIEYLETVFEMIVQRKGSEKAKWNFITSLETVKFVIKMIILKVNKKRMLVYPYVTGRELDPQELAGSEEKISTWKGSRSNLEFNTLKTMSKFVKQDSMYDSDNLSSNVGIDEYIRSKALDAVVTGPEELVPSLRGLYLGGEIVSHLRPLLYGNFN